MGQPSQVITDVEGRFAFGGLRSGRFRSEIFEGGKRTPAAIAQATAGDEALVIHLGDGVPRTLRLIGRVTDRDSGLPTRAFKVWVVQDGSRSPGKEFRDQAGVFQIDGLRPGDLWIKVEAKDPARCQIRRLTGLGPGERIEDFSLVEVGELTVTVTDQHGKPARAWVEIHDTADRELGQFRDPGLLASAGCDESGVAVFQGLPAMPLYVAACMGRPEGHGTQLAVSLTPGGRTTVGLTVR